MLVVPLEAVPSQLVNITLADQPCQIKVYQKRTGLYIDLQVLNAPIVMGVIAQEANRIVRNAYFGFIGDLAFYDTLGSADPEYSGLGARFVLMYLEATDL